jgi:hypothetical protein
MARYALDKDGNPIPWSLVSSFIQEDHPFKVSKLRAMLSIPYFERGLYEMKEEEMTVEVGEFLSLCIINDRRC